ncbi:signal peptidase II [Phreatobacter cathodiphilus]|uniref:Lipoprotein signal peptidase n=1 Tax=Phreatobacter cathodiphilus TaxID=1868589 RepID=A0A2S0NFE7_9HYPH|nr:signal peptidase II [Phreatobacter cathodiphilus]AVO46904.1 signal peptidase II [Phreatobacter cathodiphilus]
MTPSPHLRPGLLALVATLVVDQAFKVFMLQVVGITSGQTITILPVLDLVMAWNYGVSFGMFQQDSLLGQWALVLFKVAAVALIGWWLWRAESPMTAVALGLIAGGAVGNGLDRVLYGAVADFFAFHITTASWQFQWYVFNLADVGIVAGVALLLYESLFGGRPGASKSARS